jgi:plasmid stabilization system protein ParE
MRVEFHPDAQREFEESIEFYEGREPGLGLEFALEVETAIDRIVEFPEIATPFRGATRRCLVNRFPFGVVYLVQSESIFVVAVAHLHREPDFWVRRMR